jgi:hypothetical protein
MAFSTIDKGASYFNTVTYTGTGANQTITVGFKPDWVWTKRRNAAYSNELQDAVRGTTKVNYSDNTNAEDTTSTNIQTFDTNGYTQGTAPGVNGSGGTYVAWNWLGANSTATNTNGSITSTVSANTTSGFSIVSYTGNGTASATVGHGLGVAPKMIIVKNRSTSATWMVGHSSLTWASQYMQLSDTSAVHTDGATYGFKAAPTSTVFQWSSGDVANNASGSTYIAYCFAEVKGYSKFSSYTGNGSTDGTFVYTGFKPAYIMVKNTGNGGVNSWNIFDNARSSYNVLNARLYANSNAVEGTGNMCDFLSNGIKFRNTDTDYNGSANTYIYMAFASNPFVLTDGTPVTAR